MPIELAAFSSTYPKYVPEILPEMRTGELAHCCPASRGRRYSQRRHSRRSLGERRTLAPPILSQKRARMAHPGLSRDYLRMPSFPMTVLERSESYLLRESSKRRG